MIQDGLIVDAWLAGAHGTVISSIIFFPCASGQAGAQVHSKEKSSCTAQNELPTLKDVLQPQVLTSCSTICHMLSQFSSWNWKCTLNSKGQRTPRFFWLFPFTLRFLESPSCAQDRCKSETQVITQKIHQKLQKKVDIKKLIYGRVYKGVLY